MKPIVFLVPLLLALGACSSPTVQAPGPVQSSNAKSSNATAAAPASLSLSPQHVNRVTLDKPVIIGSNGDLRWVKVTGVRQGAMGNTEKRSVTLTGTISDNDWTSNVNLEPNTRYAVRAKVVKDGKTSLLTDTFTSRHVALNNQTYPTLYPSSGTFGVGQPVQVRFDEPVTNRASIERHLSVTSTPAQEGSWHWVSDNEVRYRPRTYWKPGTYVVVDADINSVNAGSGRIGQFNQESSFRIGAVAKTIRVNMRTQMLSAYANGKLVKQFGVSTGREPDFATRSGTKVIMSKERRHRMSSGTIGIDPNSGEGYDLVVDYAMRLTNSGEFNHAAPWNAAHFGREGASHGCTGASDADEAWLYNWADVGTPETFTGTDKYMTVDNGFGDWSESWRRYKMGSAL